ncbi:MAG: DUF2252 domain-containing protein [Ktedonobacteraceae bacterium]
MNNIAERLRAFNQDRNPQLVQLKYQMMRADAFAFYRGTCHLFYQDWPAQSPLNSAPLAWICGDLHWQNLGSYKGDNRLVYFNFNDFDEAELAPCTWDLARLLVSFLISADVLSAKDSQMFKLCSYFLSVYKYEIERGRVHIVQAEKTTGIVHDLLFQVKKRARKDFLDSRTTLTEEGRKLVVDGKRALAATPVEHKRVSRVVEHWGSKQLNPGFYKVLDVARRIAGVGSLGVERYVVLVEGHGSPDRNYLLDLKAAAPSSLQPYLITQQPHWNNEAERVVSIQRWVQGVPPALLAAVELDKAWYVLRELQPSEDKVNVALLNDKLESLEKLVKAIARVVAWGQLRGAGRQGVANALDLSKFASAKRWEENLLTYARFYARQVRADFEEFCGAYDHGAFEPVKDLERV